jgi:hypothetical protein
MNLKAGQSFILMKVDLHMTLFVHMVMQKKENDVLTFSTGGKGAN